MVQPFLAFMGLSAFCKVFIIDFEHCVYNKKYLSSVISKISLFLHTVSRFHRQLELLKTIFAKPVFSFIEWFRSCWSGSVSIIVKTKYQRDESHCETEQKELMKKWLNNTVNFSLPEIIRKSQVFRWLQVKLKVINLLNAIRFLPISCHWSRSIPP